MAKIALEIANALGLTALVIGLILKDTPLMIRWALEKALENPKLKAVLLEYRLELESVFDAADAELKKDLDNASKQPQQ